MPTSRRPNTSSGSGSKEACQHMTSNYNQSSHQCPNVTVINSDTGDAGELYVCKCGHNIVASRGQNKPPVAPPVNVVTYKKQIGPDKMLVVKQELEKPIVTLWVVFNAAMFTFFMLLVMIVIQIASTTVSKADEIMAVTTLLLFILIYFRPPYFIPYLIFSIGRSQETDGEDEEYQRKS